MIAIREYAKVKDHQVHIHLPKDFNFEEVEVVIMPKIAPYLGSDKGQADQIGKIGLHSRSFVEDDEDYSQW